MTREPMDVLLRMRKALVTAARQDLAQALALETAAEQSVAAAAAAIRREQDNCPADATLDFAAWLPHARAAQHQANALLAQRHAATAQRRAFLAERRADEKAVQTLLEKREADLVLAAARREQAAMDEAAGRQARRFVS